MAQIGDVSVETHYEDLTGDGVKETIVVRKTVTFLYAFAPDRYDYEVVIEIVNGRNDEILFRSQAFETEAIGVVVTSGNFRIVREDEEPVRLTYTETVVNTEHTGPEDAIMYVERHLFQWNGRSIEEKVTTVYDFLAHEEDLEELKGSARVRQQRSILRWLGSFSEPSHLRAVFSSIPALAAAVARVFSLLQTNIC